ncbi:MAG: hypothetical protein A3G08_01460 [Candidatus Magasanikbacteria bacterium RIFCSPLOWO2_12_FULL_47_9b]|nr:MAG: hypothetical protein A3I74_03165 [Candidatus Magasanikbacteria bacterium RIFCSPLOWO2_02_FULL_47_16]OGH80211.1 MAG: hypothetical protein A3C10_03445 [Candidatus Magasanikbacteria bacterium RIFCSPHIGHO2_02_FULL_48_18]OGH82704.1 MAG: hypothetical protein A3G08_01460 [Candidatus Magasanikbacteria bacterium RIFCSPLOWO2_12_FULL_47_9b]
MNLLIMTQKVDASDPILGFFDRWIDAFAAHCPSVTVLCLEEGTHDLPSSVRVFSLGKEKKQSRLRYLLRFYRLIIRERSRYDAVFVHMNPEYVVLGGLLWRLWKKPVGLWYAHGHVPFSLRIAERLASIIFTSTKSGCRVRSEKIRVVGQGIDTSFFHLKENNALHVPLSLVTVGRISEVKHLETQIDAIAILKEKGLSGMLHIIGGPLTEEDRMYEKKIRERVKEKKLENDIFFLGPMTNRDIRSHLFSADLFLNSSATGSLDKAMLEAMACGMPVFSCNDAMKEVFPEAYYPVLSFQKQNASALAERIQGFLSLPEEKRQDMTQQLSAIVQTRHGVERLAAGILLQYEKN